MFKKINSLLRKNQNHSLRYPDNNYKERSSDTRQESSTREVQIANNQRVQENDVSSGFQIPSYEQYKAQFHSESDAINEKQAPVEEKPSRELPSGVQVIPDSASSQKVDYSETKHRILEEKKLELGSYTKEKKAPRNNSLQKTYSHDTIDIKELLFRFPDMCKRGFNTRPSIINKNSLKEDVRNILVCGTEPNTNVASLVDLYIKHRYPQVKLHFMGNSEYSLPNISYKHTLIIFISKTGNTKEVLSCYRKAYALNYRCLVISGSGELETLCQRNKSPYVEYVDNYNDINASGYLYFLLLRVMNDLGFITVDSMEVEETLRSLEQRKDSYDAKALEFAHQLKGNIPLLYASKDSFALAKFWKQCFNMGSHTPAFCNAVPGMNYDEMLGFNNQMTAFYAIFLEDENDYHKIKDRMKLARQYIKNQGINAIILKVSGSNILSKVLNIMYLGHFTSHYLAREYGTFVLDPLFNEEFQRVVRN